MGTSGRPMQILFFACAIHPQAAAEALLLLTVWQVSDPATATRFDRRTNIGLHHLALAVADDATLETVYARVSAHPGVIIEFAPEPIREGATNRHFICAMPSGIRIAFATPSA